MAVTILLTIVANAHISPFDVTGTNCSNTAHIIPSVLAVWGGHYYCPHFMHIETEAQRTYVIPPRSRISGVWELGFRAASQPAEPHPFPHWEEITGTAVAVIRACHRPGLTHCPSRICSSSHAVSCYFWFILPFICWRIFLDLFLAVIPCVS